MDHIEVSRQEPPEAMSSAPGSIRRTTPGEGRDVIANSPSHKRGAGACESCGPRDPSTEGINRQHNVPPSYVYALGRIEPRFPSLSVEKEFAQAAGRAETASLTDRETLHAVLSEGQNRYLLRQLCFVFTIQGLETYLVQPRDPVDFGIFVEVLGSSPLSTDLQVVIGLRGPVAPPDFCNGLMLPVVAFDQIYAFDTDSLIRALPRPNDIEEERFLSAAKALLERVMQITDNAGASDEHRALNYLAVRYPAIYAKTAEVFAAGSSLTAIETRPSRLSGARTIVDVLFSYTSRQTDVTEKLFVRVDATEEFPHLVTKLSPYYDR